MSKKMSRYPNDRKVYVGDLGNNARKNDLEYAFSSYGTLRNVWIARNPPGFAFVEFEDARDAADAVRGLDGRTICGRRARVELSTGKYNTRSSDRGSRSRGRPFHPDDKCYECGGRGHYARDCRRYGKRRRSRSRSRSYSRDHRTRSRTGSRSRSSRSRSRSHSRDSHAERRSHGNRRSRDSRNGHRNGDAHASGDERNGSIERNRSPAKRRYDASRSPVRRSNSHESRGKSKSARRSDSRGRGSPSRSVSKERNGTH